MRAGVWPTAQFSLAHDGARRYFFISWNHDPGIRPGPRWRGIMNVQNPSASRGIVIQAVELGQELRHRQQYGSRPARRGRRLRTRQIHRHHGPIRFRQILAVDPPTLAGLDSATSGHILFGGADLTRMDDKQLTLLRRHKSASSSKASTCCPCSPQSRTSSCR